MAINYSAMHPHRYSVSNNWWMVILSFTICTIFIIIYRLKWRKMVLPVLRDKTVIISGSLDGVGLAVVVKLATLGARVIVASQNVSKEVKTVSTIMKAYPAAFIDLRYLDISILGDLQKFVIDVKKKYKKVDVLINNSNMFNRLYKKTPEGFDVILAVNYLGPFVLTHLLLPLLNKSSNGRIINVTSTAPNYSQINSNDLQYINDGNISGMYAKSKLALMLFTYHLAKLLTNTKITINAVNPGIDNDTGVSKSFYVHNYIPIKLDLWTWTKASTKGSKSIVHAVTNADLQTISGKYFSSGSTGPFSPAANDDCLAKQMYELGCKICQIDGEATIKKLKRKSNKVIL